MKRATTILDFFNTRTKGRTIYDYHNSSFLLKYFFSLIFQWEQKNRMNLFRIIILRLESDFSVRRLKNWRNGTHRFSTDISYKSKLRVALVFMLVKHLKMKLFSLCSTRTRHVIINCKTNDWTHQHFQTTA